MKQMNKIKRIDMKYKYIDLCDSYIYIYLITFNISINYDLYISILQ